MERGIIMNINEWKAFSGFIDKFIDKHIQCDVEYTLLLPSTGNSAPHYRKEQRAVASELQYRHADKIQ